MVNLNYISLKERIKGANCELKKKSKKVLKASLHVPKKKIQLNRQKPLGAWKEQEKNDVIK